MTDTENRWRVTSYEGTTPGGFHKHSVCFGRKNGNCVTCWCDVVARTETASRVKADELVAKLNRAEQLDGAYREGWVVATGKDGENVE